ncbi:hypothetical protein MAR_037955, partial [Mya arenaria]
MKSSGIKGEKARKRLLFGNVLLHDMKTDKSDRGRNTSLYSAIAGDVIKKYKCIFKLAAELDVNINKLPEVIMNGVNFAKIRRRSYKRVSPSSLKGKTTVEFSRVKEIRRNAKKERSKA